MQPQTLSIRPAQPDELDRINALVERAVDTWDLPARVKRLALSSYRYTVLDLKALSIVGAWHDERLLGVVAWERANGDSGWSLHGLYVDPQCWGRGVGSALLRHVERALSEYGRSTLWVKAQAGARAFFVQRGFVEAPSEEAGGYAHLLRKSLSPAQADEGET